MLFRRSTLHLINRATMRFYSAPTVSNVTVGDILAQREKVFSNLDEVTQGELHPHFEQWQSIRHDASVHTAVSLMVQRNIGSLIVTQEEQGVVGIVTERDVLNKVSTREEHDALAVKDIMSNHILCVEPSTTLMEALATMNKEKIRHVAVIHTEFKESVKKQSVPIDAMRCVLSIKDILKAYAEDKRQELEAASAAVVAAADAAAKSSDGATEEPKKDVPVAVTAATLLRKKHEKINLILNTRIEDNVSVAEAVAEMAKRNFGSVLVMDDGKRIKGIFTERDYMTKVLHAKLDAKTVLTTEACTKNVWSFKSDDTLHACVLEAAHRNYHHFPVVDTKDEIVGVLSVKDIVREICGETKPTPGFWLMEYFKKPAAAAKEEPKKEELKKVEPEEPKMASADEVASKAEETKEAAAPKASA
ncbi:Aste57867_22865 [Aphanomyces stellatus]|uniref:Aste57867_22865 protein n=1 Tax=Aphanomyces stellatus TaxID=120398 RepID=A0A485LN20_9STRA|nr:hypothetical protein As57867_022794 [Aphanomyces stellatus]VFT99515.1 Aste57867_22865 [Aphanomyces stellatus]